MSPYEGRDVVRLGDEMAQDGRELGIETWTDLGVRRSKPDPRGEN